MTLDIGDALIDLLIADGSFSHPRTDIRPPRAKPDSSTERGRAGETTRKFGACETWRRYWHLFGRRHG
jgi:hypothetical protein